MGAPAKPPNKCKRNCTRSGDQRSPRSGVIVFINGSCRDLIKSGKSRVPTLSATPPEPQASGGEVMAYSNILVGAGVRPAVPVVRSIGVADLRDALVKGVNDFYAMPAHAKVHCII